MRNLTNSGAQLAESTYDITSSDLEAFRIIDDLEVQAGIDSSILHEVRIYKDASNYERVKIVGGNTDWRFERVSEDALGDTGIDSYDPHRVWLYVRTGEIAIWIDDDGAPLDLPLSNVAATISGSGVPMSKTQNGQIATSPYTQVIGTDVFGSMTTS
ncbi:unnamed protein product [marine sediment metagenome]|uniref:Uncharacterized protein n=1 Tax=marine sediment metagenome TaxID=412755 RepID=X1KCQ8_9ZZZZ